MGPMNSPIARLRRLALPLLAGLAACAVLPAAAGSALGGERPAGAGLDFRIVVPAVLRVAALSDPEALAVTEDDIARGYVDVAEAPALRLTANRRAGFTLAVAFDTRIAERVTVRLLGGEVLAERSGAQGDIRTGRVIDGTVRVGYRIFLRPGTPPGMHGWPVRLGFSLAAA